jgi:membrane complex biogenesis BtpA family protein
MAGFVLPPKALVGMVHVGPTPGGPHGGTSIDEQARSAAAQARVLVEAGFDAVLIENMHDAPYVNGPHLPSVTAAMTAIAVRVRDAVGPLPLGIQILSRGEREALAVALAIGGSGTAGAGPTFIRCENFVHAHVADEGLMAEASAGPLLRYRRQIGAEHVAILCDIQKKHASHALTADLTLADHAHAAEFFGADALIVTGRFTGAPTAPSDLEAVRRSTHLPIVVGSGATPEQVPSLLERCDAIIVGSWIKRDGDWRNAVDPTRAAQFAKAARGR